MAIRGTVRDPNGDVVEGIRVSAHSDAFWGWGQSESDGTFEIRLLEGTTGIEIRLPLQVGELCAQ